MPLDPNIPTSPGAWLPDYMLRFILRRFGERGGGEPGRPQPTYWGGRGYGFPERHPGADHGRVAPMPTVGSWGGPTEPNRYHDITDRQREFYEQLRIPGRPL